MRAADMAVIHAGVNTHIPPITAEALLAGGPVLVLAPHPDDESLACGALLAAAFRRRVARGMHMWSASRTVLRHIRVPRSYQPANLPSCVGEKSRRLSFDLAKRRQT